MYGVFFAFIALAVTNRVLTFKVKSNPNLLKAQIIVGKINKYVGWFIIAFVLAVIISLFDVLGRLGML
jgi:hypothetical protein